MPYLTVPENLSGAVQAFLTAGMKDKKTFVRAWSYGGALVLARQHSSFQNWAEACCRSAMKTESAAVKARLRQMGFH